MSEASVNQLFVARALGVDAASVLYWRRVGKIPKPAELPGIPRVVAWPPGVIDAWAADLAA